MNNKILLLAFFILNTINVFSQPKTKSSYKIENDLGRFELKISIQDAMLRNNYGVAVYFSLYRNGKFLHSYDKNGGKVIGSRRPFYHYTEGIYVETLKYKDKEMGWIIKGMLESFGATASVKLNLLILPTKEGYDSFEIVSFDDHLVVKSESKISHYSSYQHWGRHGTSLSFYVPKQVDFIKGDYSGWTKETEDIEIDILEGDIPKYITYEGQGFGFMGVFRAGVENMDVKMMNIAIDEYYNEEDLWIYKEHGLPTSKQELINFVKRVEEVKKMKDEMKNTSGLSGLW